jgi:hypothetical protein
LPSNAPSARPSRLPGWTALRHRAVATRTVSLRQHLCCISDRAIGIRARPLGDLSTETRAIEPHRRSCSSADPMRNVGWSASVSSTWNPFSIEQSLCWSPHAVADTNGVSQVAIGAGRRQRRAFWPLRGGLQRATSRYSAVPLWLRTCQLCGIRRAGFGS